MSNFFIPARHDSEALIWRYVEQKLAGIAQRSGFEVRACHITRRWQVHCTGEELADLKTQEVA